VKPTIHAHTLNQETFPSVSSLLSDPANSAAKLQLLSGYITKDITDSWEGVIPTRLHQKLYRTLHKTITLHQHGLWLHRNNILHPQTDRYIPDDFGRKPALKRTLPEEEEANPRDKQWKRQREAGFTRQRMWAGTPIPAPTKKRKGTPAMVSDRCVDSDGSSTEEWPSPTNSDSETHSVDTHRAPLTSQPLPKRPRTAQAQVHASNHSRKRKRDSEVLIRKTLRPD
jgi:hypothetical protein